MSRPHTASASRLIARCVEMFGPLAAAKSIQLDPGTNTDELVLADPERVQQVLSNLVDNAIKFTPEHGSIAIAARHGDGHVQFQVTDTGPGIAPEHLPHVFERYWKAQTGGKRGTGLGLYIAKRIIETHGGKIWVESTLGQGTSF